MNAVTIIVTESNLLLVNHEMIIVVSVYMHANAKTQPKGWEMSAICCSM